MSTLGRSARHALTIAVGSTEAPHRPTLAEHWDGSAWSLVPPENPSDPNTLGDRLFGVSCATETDCIAVGYEITHTGYVALAEQWDGSSWSVTATPDATFTSGFTSVSCVSATSCVAVGYHRDASQITAQPVIERWSGRAWSV